jgi:hypothetical protein
VGNLETSEDSRDFLVYELIFSKILLSFNFIFPYKRIPFYAAGLFLYSGQDQKKRPSSKPFNLSLKSFSCRILGVYKGNLNIITSKETHKLQMEFHISETDSADKFNYVIYYGKEKEARDYN